jgi:hypothetical protein
LVQDGNRLVEWKPGSVEGPDLQTTDLPKPLPCDSIATRAARSSDAWWLVSDSGVQTSSPSEPNPVMVPFAVRGDKVASDQATPLVVFWGTGGFDVADRERPRYRTTEAAVEAAAVSPLGSLVATVGAGEMVLWRVTGLEVPRQTTREEQACDACLCVRVGRWIGSTR